MKIYILNQIYQRDTTQLVVVKYTKGASIAPTIEYLIEENKYNCISFTYTAKKEISLKLQLKQFTDAIHDVFGIEPTREIKHWSYAFIYFKRALTQKIQKTKNDNKVLIFFNEVSLLDTDGSDFLTVFGYFYNTFCQKHKNFLIILGSSNTSWIDNRLRKDTGSLYQRLDEIISMEQ